MRKQKPSRQPITLADRQAFAKHLHHWQTAFGLNDWRVTVSATPANGNVLADVTCDLGARLVSIRLGKDWGAAARDPRRVEALAVHELVHVLLYEMGAAYADPRATPEQRDSAEHRVVNTLTRLLTGAA